MYLPLCGLAFEMVGEEIPSYPQLSIYESTVVAKKKAPSSGIFNNIPSPSPSRELKMIVGSGNDVLAPPLSEIVASVSVSYLVRVDAFEDLHKKRLAVLAKTNRNICC